MTIAIGNISTNQKLGREEPIIPKIPERETITPEKVYRGFEEWRKLGKQDPTESRTITQPSEPEKGEESKSP